VIHLHDSQHTAASIIRSLRIPSMLVAVVTCPNFGQMLGHLILLTTYPQFILTMLNQAAQLMDDILTPIPIELIPVSS
jgi:hypothetical protein